MDISVKDIIQTMVAILLAGLIEPLLPETITEVQPLSIVNNSTVQIILLTVVAFYLISKTLSWVRDLLGPDRTPFFGTVSRRWEPNHVDAKYEVDRFGVTWPVLYGRRRITGDRYAFAEEPRCPHCDTELMEDTNRRRIRKDMKLWRCPGCGFTKKRPRTWLHSEKEAVEKSVESMVRNNRP